MPRLFVGTFLSDDGVEKLAGLASANQHLLEEWNAKVRWVDKSKFHITWVFLGEIETETIPKIVDELKLAFESKPNEDQPLSLVYDRFEIWPNARNARLAVIAPTTVPDGALHLDLTIKTALKKFLQSDQSHHELKDFKPHITVLRFPRDHRHEKQVRPKVEDIKMTDHLFPILHEIKEIALIESTLGQHVDGYRKLATFPLNV